MPFQKIRQRVNHETKDCLIFAQIGLKLFLLRKEIIFILTLPLYHFYFNLILFAHSGHVGFNFNQYWMFTECCFYLLKRFEQSKSLLFRFPQPNKKFPTQQNLQLLFLVGIFNYPWTLFAKSLICPYAPQEDFWKKFTEINITCIYLLCTNMVKFFKKKSFEQIKEYKVA